MNFVTKSSHWGSNAVSNTRLELDGLVCEERGDRTKERRSLGHPDLPEIHQTSYSEGYFKDDRRDRLVQEKLCYRRLVSCPYQKKTADPEPQ